jgi:hypothetical protein
VELAFDCHFRAAVCGEVLAPFPVRLHDLANRLLACDNYTMSSLSEKLNPNRFTAMSGFFAAVVGYVLSEAFTSPKIADMKVNEEEGVVYIQHEGDAGYDTIESLEVLRENWNKLMDAADLTPEERREAVELFRTSVGIFPGTQI